MKEWTKDSLEADDFTVYKKAERDQLVCHHESTLQSQSHVHERLSVTRGKLAICYTI